MKQTMKKIFAIAIAFALFFGVSVAFADEMTKTMLMNQFSGDQILEAQQMIKNAKKEGLPVEPLMGKAYEGMAKGVPAEKILQAMKKVNNRYSVAHRYANGLTEEKGERHRMREMIADCLSAGLNDKEVETIGDKLQERAKDMTKAEACELAGESFMAARDITRLGATSMAATNVVGQALDHGYDAEDMEIIRLSFTTQMKDTSLATDLAMSYADSISRGESAAMLWSPSRIEAAGTGISPRSIGSPSGSGSPSGGGSSSQRQRQQP